MSRFHVPARDSPRSGHDFLGPRESQVERGRACLASPREGGSLERLLEIHDARREPLIVHTREGSESGGEVRQAKRVNLFLLREAEHAKGSGGHDAQGPFRAEKKTFQAETRRGSGDGPGSNHASVREDGLEAKDLISHRSAKIAGIADAVRPDGPADGGARPGPGIVSNSETMPPELAVQRLQDDSGLHGGRAGSHIDGANPSHVPKVQDDRIGFRTSSAHETRSAAPGDYVHPRVRGE